MSTETRGLVLSDEIINISEGNKAILERIGNLIMAGRGERVNLPQFGSLLNEYLFRPGFVLRQHVESNLKNMIEFYEPLVQVVSCDVSYDEHMAYIRIELKRKDTLEVIDFNENIALEKDYRDNEY